MLDPQNLLCEHPAFVSALSDVGNLAPHHCRYYIVKACRGNVNGRDILSVPENGGTVAYALYFVHAV